MQATDRRFRGKKNTLADRTWKMIIVLLLLLLIIVIINSSSTEGGSLDALNGVDSWSIKLAEKFV